MCWEYTAFVVFFPQIRKLSVIQKKTSDKPKPRDIL